ncbi:FG-GAP repeat domain-containing protein [Brevifollis gellanilyticus]|uniref:Fibronectin type-III domain-containing protein n=1 Tax=Brevifollis gellanilyticus TaxID=748831 RepID=A0A512M5Y1_9BACT|nr:VCBS repeat-containing protein [Brevifollis gellanilyticus]GEP42142.1 hypothetical protein BGE01nite_14330 [Brevifollis gellanilyticus]
MNRLSRLFTLLLCLSSVHAADTTPPTLNVQHTWMEKIGGITHFKMLLDPRDETGFAALAGIEFRSKLNSTAALPDSTPWNAYPWIRGQPFDIPFNCTSVVFELRARDAAGNVSPLQRRTFASPFPYSTPPNTMAKFGGKFAYPGNAIACVGLFGANFDGVGIGDDIVQIDRVSGEVRVRRQPGGSTFAAEDSIFLTGNSVTDSAMADFDGDGRPDLAVVVDGTLKVMHNDGLNVSNALTFTTAEPTGMSTLAYTSVVSCAVADVTGEGKPDIIITGTANDPMAGAVTRIAVLVNNDQNNLTSANYANAGPSTSPGQVRLGDVNGDGWTDAVMVDPANQKLVTFRNKTNGSFGSADEVDESLRPREVSTGHMFEPITARALAVGDVTGDGRADAVAMMHWFVSTNIDDRDDTRDHQMWQLFDALPDGSLHVNPMYEVGVGPRAVTPTDFNSDVLLQDLDGDRFPEIIVTSKFEPMPPGGSRAGGIRAYKLTCQLSPTNTLQSFDLEQTVYATDAGNPHRLAPGRFSGNQRPDILLANASNPQLQWLFSNYTPLSKPTDIAGGATTDSDATGVAGSNGIYSYTEYPGGGIGYSITCVNNTSSPLAGVTLESTLPAEFILQSNDLNAVVSGTGAARVIRWTTDVPADSAVVRNFRVNLSTTTKTPSFSPKIQLKQGTKVLISAYMPLVKLGAVNFTAIPDSPGQLWIFSYKPASVPPNSTVTVQASPDGMNWLPIPSGQMSEEVSPTPKFSLITTTIPDGSRYFRAAVFSEAEGFKYSSVFNTFLPPTTALKITTKSPPKTGQTWTFAATQTSTAANVQVRFQSTLTPDDEYTWTDLPAYAETARSGNTWTSNTYNIPSGNRYFRAISSAPGWVDSISGQAGPYNVQQSSPQLPYFTYYHIDFKSPIRHGDSAAFMASCPAVFGLKVRFQSRPAGSDDNAWTDLTDGQTTVSGTKWTFMSKYLPVGNRDWRAVASAPGYNDNTQRITGKVVSEALYTFEVLPAPLPQMATVFAPFNMPEDGSVQRNNVNFNIGIDLLDFNGVQRVFLLAGPPNGVYKEVPGVVFTHLGGVSYIAPVKFTGTGDLYLCIGCTDGYSPSQTKYSTSVRITIGSGTGSSFGPVITAPAGTPTHPTKTALGSVLIKARIGDDAQVWRAFVHRMTSDGQFLHTVGEMKRGSTANPSDFTCTDGALDAGQYFYRVVAQDYENHETVGATFGPVTLTAPAPPPGPIYLNVVSSSQHVQPKLPKTNPNYPYIPYATSGTVTFDYSGLPAGTTYFLAYRVDRTSDDAYITLPVTKTTGSATISSPEWDEETYGLQGPGEYQIIAVNSGNELTIGSGDNTFRVGRSWNQPDSFTELDYGLYWFKDVNNGLKGFDSSQRDDYFDPDKPTVIYVHGWQSGEVKLRRRESWKRQDPFKDSTTYNMCQYWKKQGYNVGMFNWNQFADASLLESQANIYYIASEPDMPAGHSMFFETANTYDAWTKQPESTRRYRRSGKGGSIENKTVCDLLLAELSRCMGGYVPTSNKEFRMIGHSLGTQLVGRTCDVIRENPGWGIPLPTRISLLELAQIHGLDPRGLNINDLQYGYISRLKAAGVAIDCYQSTDLQSLLGINLSFVGNIHDMCAYSRWRPDFITPINWSLDIFNKSVGPGGVFVKSHNELVRWYMHTFNYPASTFEAWTYRGLNLFAKDQRVGNALTASTSNAAVRALMNGNYWFEQSGGGGNSKVNGKATQDLLDDEWERKGSP